LLTSHISHLTSLISLAMHRIFLFAIIAAISLTGCSLKKMTTRTVGAISWDGQAVLERDSDVGMARNNTIPLIRSLEVFSAGDPEDRRYLALLSKSYGQYAFGFYEEDMLRLKGVDEVGYAIAKRRADLFYERGMNYGKRALKTRELIGPLPEMEQALSKQSEKEVPVLFWSAFSWGNWLNLHRDDPLAIVEVPQVTAIVERVVELDPSYEYGAALSFMGALNSVRPAMLGGKPEEAREYFDRAIETGPNYLMNKIMMAQYYAIQVQDKELFTRLLREVLASDPAALPERRLANEIAQRRAKLLLDRIKEYF
jgi:tetratricopeptide (TPR) repeat protein